MIELIALIVAGAFLFGIYVGLCLAHPRPQPRSEREGN